MHIFKDAVISLLDRIPGKNLPLEHITFLFGATAGIVLSLFGFIANTIIGLHLIAILIPLINLIVDASSVVYSLITKRWKGPAVLVYFFASFVLFPFLWFSSGGTLSSSLPLVIGLGVVLAIVFQGKLRIFFFFTTLLVFSSFIIIEMYFPDNFIPYPNDAAMYKDILFGFVLSYLASGGLAYYALVRYNAAKRKAESLILELDRISKIDALTEVFNRRHLMVNIDEEMRKAFDDLTPLSLCILDIDHFKNVNDTYGHLAGDKVLVTLASTISNCLSENELLGRYGGEEFIVVFRNSDLPASLKIVNNFVDELKKVDWPHGEPVTVSIGMSTYSKGISYSKFLETADKNLYKAKENGRDRIEY